MSAQFKSINEALALFLKMSISTWIKLHDLMRTLWNSRAKKAILVTSYFLKPTSQKNVLMNAFGI